ncbi:adenosylcobinamide-GDP ribazoletransferase [Kribbella sp. NPDC023855]|uniref:adenosylcobinamide-GDP ribazoletransferase n=1 Tax=Kribbella sp. NPDC023855 TaxID=3154698 RepID=UPI0033FEC2D1
MTDGLKLAFGTLSILPAGVPGTVDRKVAGRAMTWAPLVGLVLGGIAALVVNVTNQLKPEAPWLSAVLGIVVLMALSGALHLDGLADTADGFGSRRDRETKLRIMKQSDIGPFGVVSIVAVLLIDVAALQACIQNEFGWQALLIAGVASRLTLPWSCRTSVPSARPDGLGAMVAGTVRPYAAALVTLAGAGLAAVLGWLTSWAALHPSTAVRGDLPWYSNGNGYPVIRPTEVSSDHFIGVDVASVSSSSSTSTLGLAVLGTTAAVLVAVLLAIAVTRRTRRSLGGITGDTLGATVELALPLTLLTLAFTT